MTTTSAAVPEDVSVGRSDPVYMAHAYLTKVPVAAIEPFIAAFTQPGDIVLDPFAGSGMTGVAAALLGRRARLFDISVLGRHIGRNYLNLVESDMLRKHAQAVLRGAAQRLGDIYGVVCDACRQPARLVKAVWSVQVACASCGRPASFYAALEAADWHKTRMSCPDCDTAITSRDDRVGEIPVLHSIKCRCSTTQREQPPGPALTEPSFDRLWWPDLKIEPTRQMYQASALGRHGLTSTARFFSARNLAALAALSAGIDRIDDASVQDKLRFCFTAILARASKRYQWSRQRPLNAANANYYVAPVFYEWNVFDLFERKVEAVIRSDEWIRDRLGTGTLLSANDPDVTYDLASAERLPLPDNSVDYVFTDPPFGSNIFYADMNLFHEAWLGQTTDHEQEAVVDRTSGPTTRTAARYEALLANALRECHRVLKPGGRISLVFGNSAGTMWALVQRAIEAAGLQIDPDAITLLDKGQRSVKGLASGFENVATLDLILTLKSPDQDARPSAVRAASAEVDTVLRVLLAHHPTPSHLYIGLLREGMRRGWDISQLDLRRITRHLDDIGLTVEAKTGRISAPEHVH